MTQFFWFMLALGLGSAAYAVWRPSFGAYLIAAIVNGIAIIVRLF